MNESVSFSFVMPAYKAKFLHQTIDSILNQSYQNFELIIVNDASPDNLKLIVNQFTDNRIIYKENKENIGASDLVANWNECIKYANNDYIILATDDDTFEPVFLAEAVKLIERYPKTNLIRSGVKKIGEDGQTIDVEFPLKEFMTCQEFTLYWAKGQMISCVSNYIFRKKTLIEMGGFISFPHAHFSDDATALAAAKEGVACISNICMNFRVSNINLSNQGGYRLAVQQIKATDAFMSWYLDHVEKLDTNNNYFWSIACYGGCKCIYLPLIEKLLNKIPFYKFNVAVKIIVSLKHLFKKEKIKLFISVIINKL